MLEVNIHQAKFRLSELLRRVAAGEEVIIDAATSTATMRLVQSKLLDRN
jgi:antitoxin (DNA-binding transcriptional repressor) of toxin-antitoxin stability system